MRVLILAHGREIEPGWLLDALEEVAADHALVDLSLGDPFPLDPWDKVVVLGGHMGAYDVEEYPWLAAEKALIASYLADQIPLLGVCLGAQLVADVIGGRAYRAPGTEAGLITLQRTASGEKDPVLAAVSGPVVAWHHDTFHLPPEAELLAFTADYPHAFRYGSALGVQFHPEVTPAMWDRWVASAGTEDLVAAGLDPGEFAMILSTDAGRLRSQAIGFFRTWLEE